MNIVQRATESPSVCVRVNFLTTQNASKQTKHDLRKENLSHIRNEYSKYNFFWTPKTFPFKPIDDISPVVLKDFSEDTISKEIVPCINSIVKKKTGRKVQSRYKHFITGLVSFSLKAQQIVLNNLTKARDFDISAKDCFWNFLVAFSQKFNAPLVYYALHRDEASPHFHFMFANVNLESGKSLIRTIYNRETLSSLQDMVGQCFSPMGISRGKKKFERLAQGDPNITHQNISLLRNELPFRAEMIEELRAEIKSLLERRVALEKENTELSKEVHRLSKLVEKYRTQMKLFEGLVIEFHKYIEEMRDDKVLLKRVRQAMTKLRKKKIKITSKRIIERLLLDRLEKVEKEQDKKIVPIESLRLPPQER